MIKVGRSNKIEKMKRINGITLIALVVTIVVLLILAGISINLLWGEHGILNTAKDAKVTAKIAEIEDQANVIYKGLETGKLVGTKESITMGEIASKLQANGYQIQQETGAGSVVTGITLDKTSLTLNQDDTATITVTPKQSTDGNIYYAVIEGKAYKMDFTEGGVVIQKTPSDKEITPSENKVNADSSNEEIVGKPEINGMKVNITAKNVGTATITINYGGQTATCTITVSIAKGEKVTGENKTYTDENGKTAIIPVGFCVVKDGTVDPNSNNVTNGLVISDVANDDLDNKEKGNQFVWIPVENYNDFHLIEGYASGSLQTLLSQASNPSREAGSSKTAKLPGKPNEANSVLGTDESVAMYDSVRINKGFYIARFEMGVPNTTESTITNDTNKKTQDGTVKPVSKKGVGVWNFITWGGTTALEASDGLQGNDNANGAVKVARSMYTKSDTCGVTSTLCYGVQWDATLKFIEPNYGEYNEGKTDYNNITSDNFVKNSSGKGNYKKEDGSSSIAVTGSNLAYQQKHVYDLAGNVWEWTMEAYITNLRVYRGGSYANTGSSYSASFRGSGYAPDGAVNGIGARLALYL